MMNYIENDSKIQSPSGNLPVFFTGLAETVNKEPKIPLLCILCGSSLVNKRKNNDDPLEKNNSYNGCENCAKNFDNIKAALELLSKLSSPSTTAPHISIENNSHISPLELKDDNANISRNKRKSLLPHPVSPPTPNGMLFNLQMDTSPEYNNIQEEYIIQNDKPPDLKRKLSFQSSSPKRLRSDCSPTINSYHNTPPRENTYEKLGNSIWQLYIKHKQTQNVYDRKMALRDKLHEMLLTAFPTCGLYVVGSSMTGLGAKSSDMDMCLMLTHDEIDQEREATNILHTVRDVFLNCNFLQNVEVIYAKVPILRFTDSVSGIEVDLNVNNAVGIRNTQLLSSYARIDERFPPLVLLVKMWARYHGINDAKNNSLSSYSLVLMVIHFLQYGCQPPVLPCLQQLQPDKYRPNSDVRKLKLREELPDFISENKMNLGDLFIGFLTYFAHEFNYFSNVMSVRLGGIIPKEVAMNNTYSSKNKRAHWKWVCIEEPFELTNTACAVFKPDVFHYIRQVFSSCCAKIKRTAHLNSVLK